MQETFKQVHVRRLIVDDQDAGPQDRGFGVAVVVLLGG
jgi:hypothetical protein